MFKKMKNIFGNEIQNNFLFGNPLPHAIREKGVPRGKGEEIEMASDWRSYGRCSKTS